MAFAPRLKRIRVIGAKAETTPGTAETLADAQGIYKAFNVSCVPEVEMEERPALGGFGHDPAVAGPRKGRFRFNSYLFGNSAAPTWAACFLPAVGLGDTGSAYALSNQAPEVSGSTLHCLTLGSYQNGRKKSIFGAMGNLKLSLPAGKLAIAEFDFLGKWAAPVDAAILAPTYHTLAPLRVVSAELTIGTYAFKLSLLTLDLGNVVHLREDVDDATGYHNAVIANRRVTGTIDPEASLVGDDNVYGDWLSSAEKSLSVKCVSGSDSVIIAATKLQIQKLDEADREGVETENIGFALNAEDLSLTFA